MVLITKVAAIKPRLKLLWIVGIILLAISYGLYGAIAAHADTTNTFSGILKDQNGNAIAGVKVQLRDAQNHSVTSQTTTTGSFSVAVSPGMYSLRVYNDWWLTTPSRLVKFSLAQPISNPTIDLTTNSISQDLTLPLGKVNYTERNAQGYATSYRNMLGQAPASNTPPVTLYPGASDAIEEQATDSGNMTPNLDGTGTFVTILGTAYQGIANTHGNQQDGICTIVVTDATQEVCNETPFTASDTANNVDIPKPSLPRNTFTGKLSDSTGAIVKGVKITLRDTYGNEVPGDVSWSDGHFSIAVEPGIFSLTVEGSTMDSPFGAFKFAQSSSDATIDLTSSNVSQDLTLPVGIVNFTTTNEVGGIISGAKIIAKGTITNPLSLYPGGPLFSPVQTTLISQKIFSNYQGIGSFKTLVGATYHGTSADDGVCTDETGETLCNTTPLVVGTNNIAIGPH